MAGPDRSAPTLDPAAIAQIAGFDAAYKAASPQVFAGVARDQHLQAGEILHNQDEALTHVWVLVEGTIAEMRRDASGSKARVWLKRTVGPGAWLGIYDYLFETVKYRTRAVAQEPCRLIALEMSDLGRMIYQAPQLRQVLANFPLISRLRTLPTLRDVEVVGLGMLAEAVAPADLVTDELLYGTGDPCDYIAFIDQGQMLLAEGPDGLRRWVGNGGAVGVSAAVNERGPAGERVMDHQATAALPTRLLKVPHRAFCDICGFIPDPVVLAEQKLREETVANLAIVGQFSEEQKRHLTGYFSYCRYPVHHLLLQQNEGADSLWVLLDGSLAEVRALDKDGRKLMPTVARGPTYFAETALLGEFPARSTVEAVAGSEWLRLHWVDFEQFDIVEPMDLREKLLIPDPQQGIVYGKAARKRYTWLEPGETVVYFTRRHWVGFLRKNLPSMFITALLALLAFITVITPGVNPYVLATMIVLGVLGVLAFIWGVIDYYNDWLVVTNRRVYHQEQLIFVNQWHKEAPLEQIQNVDYERNVIGRLLNFGTLQIQTAGSYGDVSFTYATHFNEVDKAVREQRAQRQRSTIAQNKLKINRQLEDRLGLLVEPPSRVFTGKLEGNIKTGWQQRFAQRAGAAVIKESDERIVWRQHWMALVGRIGWVFWVPFLIVMMGFISWYVGQIRTTAEIELTTNVIEWILGLTVVAFVLRFIWVAIDWYNDTYELTKTDVVNMKQLPFGLRQQRRSAGLGRIQNVEMRIPSPLHLLFDYGTVTIQTAAEDGALVFRSVPNPRFVASEISRRIEAFQHATEEEQARRRMEDLPDWFEMYNRMDSHNETRRKALFPPPPSTPPPPPTSRN